MKEEEVLAGTMDAASFVWEEVNLSMVVVMFSHLDLRNDLKRIRKEI